MPATTEKPPALAKELAALERMTAAELRDKYAAVFGEPAASGNRAWLARGRVTSVRGPSRLGRSLHGARGGVARGVNDRAAEFRQYR